MTEATPSPAPDFDLADQAGRRHRLADYHGRWLVLYFYPKDDTPGCTREACDFRDRSGALGALGAAVLGVSADSGASHGKFDAKYGLGFPLLADEGGAVARAYGAYGEKSTYGKTYEGVLRQTFLVDPEGRIARAWRGVKVDGHAAEVEATLRSLGGQPATP